MAVAPISSDLYQLCSTEKWGRNATHKILDQFLIEHPFFIDELKGLLTNEKIEFWTQTPSIPEIAQPTVLGMKKMAAHYADKYAITIHVLSIEEFARVDLEEESVFGIIIYDEDPAVRLSKHVCPILIQCLQGKKEAIILDSLGFCALDPMKILQENQFTSYFSAFIRQADDHSCRTDALCTLRNGLLAHQLAVKENPLYRLSAQFASDPTSEKDLWQMRSVPHEWVYTGQISNKAPESEMVVAVRDCFSKKRKEPRTVIQFRAEYQQEFVLVHTLAPEKERGFSIEEKDVHSGSSDIQLMAITPHEHQIIKTTRKSINTYLAQKSFKNLRKHFT